MICLLCARLCSRFFQFGPCLLPSCLLPTYINQLPACVSSLSDQLGPLVWTQFTVPCAFLTEGDQRTSHVLFLVFNFVLTAGSIGPTKGCYKCPVMLTSSLRGSENSWSISWLIQSRGSQVKNFLCISLTIEPGWSFDSMRLGISHWWGFGFAARSVLKKSSTLMDGQQEATKDNLDETGR